MNCNNQTYSFDKITLQDILSNNARFNKQSERQKILFYTKRSTYLFNTFTMRTYYI